MSANTNCLEGLKCPGCGSLGPFDIVLGSARAIVHDDGIEETAEHDWNSNSPIRCRRCDDGWCEVGDFREAT